MAAREPGEEGKRPSVETPLHDFFPEAYVVHTHPVLINALACSRRGAEEARALFGDRVLWIPAVKPGLRAGRHGAPGNGEVLREARARPRRAGGAEPRPVRGRQGLRRAPPQERGAAGGGARPRPGPSRQRRRGLRPRAGRRAGPRRAHAAAGRVGRLHRDLPLQRSAERLPGRLHRLHPRPRGLLQPRAAVPALGRRPGGPLPPPGGRDPGIPAGQRLRPQDRRGGAPGGLRLGTQPEERRHRHGRVRGRPEGGPLQRGLRGPPAHAGGAGPLHPGLGSRGAPQEGQRRAGQGRARGREDRPGDGSSPGLRPGHRGGAAGRRGQRGPRRPERRAGPGQGRGAGPALRDRPRAGRDRRRDRRGLGGRAWWRTPSWPSGAWTCS